MTVGAGAKNDTKDSIQMKSDKCQRGFAIVVIGVLSSITSTAFGQHKIPYDVVTATTALSIEQQETINRYINHRTELLLQGTKEQIVEARQELTEPLIWAGGTEIFHLAYSSAANHYISQGLNSDRLLVRLNTMIVVHDLKGSGVVSLIQRGLGDANPSVRYWAGKAVTQAGIQGRLSIQEQTMILNVLVLAIQKETSEHVLQRLLVGLVGLNIPESASKLLDELNNRVALHAANPNLPLSAAIEGLRTLFVKTVEAKSNGQDVPSDAVRQIALVAYRYLALSATLLDTDRFDEEHRNQYLDMIELVDAALGWTARQMSSNLPVPPSIKDDLERQNWPIIRLHTEEWKRLLEKAPFNFGAVDLMVTIPEKP